MPLRSPARVSLFALCLVALLAASVVPLAVGSGVPGRLGSAAKSAEAEESPPLRPGPAYWLAAADGGVFAFGRAAYAGSAADAGLQRAVVGVASTNSANGYWLVARDGGVFAFGDES